MGADRARSAMNEPRRNALQAEWELVAYRLDALHKEMMRLSSSKRRERWEEYYRRLGELVRHQQELQEAIEALRDP